MRIWTKPTARMLNAGDNAWHIQLTDWERALQMQKLRAIGIPVESANGEPVPDEYLWHVQAYHL